MDIPAALKALREAKGLNMRQLARASNVSAPYLRQIEMGIKKNPSAAVLQKLATALGVTVADIMGTQTTVPASSLAQAPESLKEFVRRSRRRLSLRQEDIEVLRSIHYRGSSPETPEDWELIFLFLKRLLG